jgi:hypothetical protein
MVGGDPVAGATVYTARRRRGKRGPDSAGAARLPP